MSDFVRALLVAGAIAIGVMVILPGLRHGHEPSPRTLCLSNLKQIGAAMAVYSVDSDEHFPPPDKMPWVLYESYVHPLTILSTLPSAGVGALLAMLAFGLQLTVISLIGIILLIGIVKKNGIMMIDFALTAEREHGKSARDAIYEACLLRFRPIMMTTMCALLSGLPLMLGHGSGSELRRPLGYAMVGGLILSQMLTLFTTPVVYLYLDRAHDWYERRKQARRARKAALQPLPGTH